MTATLTESSPAAARIDTALDVLGRLLEYPGGDFEEALARATSAAGGGECRPRLAAFRAAMLAQSRDEREETYTATFDVTPRCVPYLSIHLFGEENFKRGEFMAALHQQYETSGFRMGAELPDHIGTLLRYAASLGEPERRELVEFCILGPLGKLIESLAAEHPYRALLETVDCLLRAHYPGIRPALSPLEQMLQHGGSCPVVSAGCNCGAPLASESASEPTLQPS